MLQRYFSPTVTQRLRSGPLGQHLDSFATSLSEAGYAPVTGRIQLRLLAKLGNWLRRTRRTAADLDSETADVFLATYSRRRPLQNGHRWTVRRFVEHLQRLGVGRVGTFVVPATESPLLPLEQRYESHLQKERGLTAATVERYGWFVHRFLLERFGEGPLAPSKLHASDVSSFIVKHAGSVGPKRAQLMVTALRSFFRFLVREGETQIDLAASVPTVPCRQQVTVPKYISDREVHQLLASCDRSKPEGRRDYAVLLLLARLGLRAGEVAGLQLEDIDWTSGEIRVLGKGQVRDRLPLLSEVGRALVAYLHRDRPRSSSHHVFLRVQAPRRHFGNASAVSKLVRRALSRAGLNPPVKGAHLLRHSLATSLLRKGASMTEIAEVLRHRAVATTQIYAKVDIPAVRALAQPWPTRGGAR